MSELTPTIRSKEETELIAACVSAPADNGPRLVYGDWLQAHGDPRGELMVVQCRLAEGATGADEKKLRATERKLAKTIEKSLAHKVAAQFGYHEGFVDGLVFRLDIERGFISALQAPADILKKLEVAFEVAPLFTELRLSGIPPYDQPTVLDASFLESPLLSRVESIVIAGISQGDRLLDLFAKSPRLSNLRALAFNATRYSAMLGVEGAAVTARGVSAIAASPYLGNLTRLCFDDDELGDEGIDAIAKAPWKLESLSVANNNATGAALDSLAHAKLDTLRRLRICGIDEPEEKQIAALVSSRHLTGLVALDIEKCDLGPKGLAAMLDAWKLTGLEELIAASNGFGEKGAELIAGSTKWSRSKLKVLDITKNQFNKKGIIALAKGPGLAGIPKILFNERDSEDARKALAESKTLAKSVVYFRGKQLARSR